jgi:pimeloyl-ACP methyl ester carboxylesterase
VGHDWGGAVGWAMAARNPDRLKSLTVLSTPHPAAFTSALWRSAQAVMSGYMAYFQLPWLPEATLRMTLRSLLTRSGLPAIDADRYAHLMFQNGALTGALNWYRALP